jgi:hypothetical protein
MVTVLLSLLAFATVLVSAGTTWSENLVLADCGIGLGVKWWLYITRDDVLLCCGMGRSKIYEECTVGWLLPLAY